MANEVQITVKAKDQTKQAFSSVDKSASGLKSSLSDVGKVAGGVLSANVISAGFSALKGGFDKAIGGASDLNESMSKTDQVFESSAGEIHNWAKGAETSMGMSQQAAESNANSLGLLFTQVGFNTKGASDMSQKWVQLAADLGSFNNADPTQVLEAMSAATRGEYDSLQQYVPMVNAATVEQKALEMSGKKTADMLTAQDKSLALNKLMFEQTGKAQGDFARTSDGVANQAKIAQAQMENSAAALGQAFLPAIASVMGAVTGQLIPTVREMGTTFGDLPGPVKIGLGALTGIVAAAPLAVGSWKKIKGAVDSARTSYMAMGTAGKVASVSLGVIGIALAAGAILLGSYAAKQAEAKQQIQSFSDVLREQKGAINDVTLEAARSALEQANAGSAAEDLGVDFGTLTQAYAGNAEAMRKVRDRTKEVIQSEQDRLEVMGPAAAAMDSQGDSAKKLNEQLDIAEKAQKKSSAETKRAGEVAKTAATGTQEHTDAEADHAAAMKESEDKAKAEADALKDLIDKLTSLGRMTLSESDAQMGFQEAIDSATESLKDNGKTVDTNTAKGRANKKALDDIAKSTLDWVETGAKAKLSQETLNGRLNAGAIAYGKAATAAGVSTSAVNAYTQKVFGVPYTRVTKLNADKSAADKRIAELQSSLRGVHDKKTIAKINANIAAAQAARRKIQGEINGLRDKSINIDINRRTNIYTIVHPKKVLLEKGMATGGPVRRGESYIVGEKRPELFVPDQDGTIVPQVPAAASHSVWGAGGSAGGGSPVVLEIRAGDSSAYTKFLVGELQKYVRVNGGNVQSVLGR